MPPTSAPSPIPARATGYAIFAGGGRGVQAAWQEWRKTLAGVKRTAATWFGSRWQSGSLGWGELAEFPVAARRGSEQRLGVLVLGRAEHLLGRAVLDDPALAHYRDVVADLRRDAQVVGDEQHGEVQPLADLVEQL